MIIQTTIGEVTMRLRKLEDLDAFAKYVFESPKDFLEHIGFDTSSFEPKEEWLAKRRKLHLEAEAVGKKPNVAVAEFKGRPIAMVNGEFDHPDGQPRVHFHIFHPENRGRGLGGPILMAGIRLLRQTHNLGIFWGEPKASNKPINALLKKLGCRYLGEFIREAKPGTQRMTVSRYEIPI